MYQLRDELRPLARPRIAACGHVRVSSDVGLVAGQDGKCRYQGIATCGSIWECPVCQMNIKAKRAEEVTRLVEWHGPENTALLTLTVRHALGDDLRALRRKVANAWRALTRGEPWKRFESAVGLVGNVRALEVTHGENGFHPHLHVLLLLRDGWQRQVMSNGTPVAGWLTSRWQQMVERHIGAEFTPNAEHGAALVPCRSADYVSKLGLEISDPGKKHGRHESRTMLQVSVDWVEHGDPRDAQIWRAYCQGMKGARQLTWSRGLKRRAGIRERTDEQLAADEATSETDRVVLVIAGRSWDTLRNRKVGPTAATTWVLEQAEIGGSQAAECAVALICCGRVGTPTARRAPPR